MRWRKGNAPIVKFVEHWQHDRIISWLGHVEQIHVNAVKRSELNDRGV
jgi:hypothetical protein